jgi:hypothetical protein
MGVEKVIQFMLLSRRDRVEPDSSRRPIVSSPHLRVSSSSVKPLPFFRMNTPGAPGSLDRHRGRVLRRNGVDQINADFDFNSSFLCMNSSVNVKP